MTWPTQPGGLSSEEDWASVDRDVARLLAALMTAGEGAPQGSLAISYIPFTALGRDEGYDCSWEAQLSLSGVAVDEVGLGGHPVLALQELPSFAAAVTREVNQTGLARRDALVEAFQREWSGLGELLREAASLAATAQASPQEPTDISLDVAVEWAVGPDRDAVVSSWTVTASDAESNTGDDGDWTEMRWTGNTPAEALRSALADVGEWFADVHRPRVTPA